MIPDGHAIQGKWGALLAGCLALSVCSGTMESSATVLPLDSSTTQITPGTAPVSTSPGAATSADAATNVQADAAGADVARGDAVVLTEALEGGDYAALARVVGERVAPRVGGGAYATALVDALGARGLVRVAAHLPAGGGGVTGRAGSGGSGTGSTGPGVPLACTWTSLLATATTSPLWDEGRREALARDLTALVTVTGDVAEADTLLLPAGFMRLLTADRDPLTTAIAGTRTPGTATGETPGAGDGQVSGAGDQTPEAGGGRSDPGQVPGVTSPDPDQAPGGDDPGARDPLALDPKFLASLVRGLMAGETAGGSRIGWVEYARLATTAGGGYSNFPGGTPREVRARYSSYDPLAAVLTATARAPATVLDVLAPLLPGADPSTLGPSGKGRRPNGVDVYGGTAAPGPSGRNYGNQPSLWVDGSLWEWVAARTQRSGTACLEALTAAVASASTLRYQATTPQPNPYEAQATWLTEQATITLADVGTATWTPTARRATAVMLANSMGDIDNVANAYNYNDLEDSFSISLPKGWRRTQGIALRILLSEVLRDDTALAVVSWAAEVFITHRLATDAFKVPPGTTVRNASYYYVRYVSVRDARLYGYVYGSCAIGRGEDGESPAAGVVLAALDRGPDPVPDPGAPWRPPATPAQATQATQASDRSLTREQLGDAVADRLRLKVVVVLGAAGLVPREAYALKDGRPAHGWITLGDDGVWHVDQEAALADPIGLNSWLSDAWTEQSFSDVTTWLARNVDDGVLEAQIPRPTDELRALARHAVLVAVLTAATALLVYSLSHTHQRRRERLRPIREERRRRWRERIGRWYEEE